MGVFEQNFVLLDFSMQNLITSIENSGTFKGTYKFCFRISFYNVNQKPIPRTNLHIMWFLVN